MAETKICPDCEARLERAKRTRYGLTKDCPNGCGFYFVTENKWINQKE